MLKRLLLAAIAVTLMTIPVRADDLGPSTTAGTGSDPGTLNVLQPANSTGIPSTNAAASGLGLPDASSALQPAGTRAQLPNLDFIAEADGSPQDQSNPTVTPNYWGALIIGLIAVLLLISAFFIFRISKLVDPQPEADMIKEVDIPDEVTDQTDDTIPAPDSLGTISVDDQEPIDTPDEPTPQSSDAKPSKPSKKQPKSKKSS